MSLAASAQGDSNPTFHIATLNITANDLIWDSSAKRIYASIPSTVPIFGNSIIAIDPQGPTVVAGVFAGSEPSKLAISGDHSFLYVGFFGSNSILRFKLPALTPDITIDLGSDPFYGPNFAQDIQVLPGSPHSIAVVRFNTNVSPAANGIAVYDDAVERPNASGKFPTIDSIQFGSTDSALFGYDNEDTGFDLYQISVNTNGVTIGQGVGNLISGFGITIHYDKGLLYADSGAAVDPLTFALVGSYSASGLVYPESRLNGCYFLFQDFSTGNVTIEAFNQNTFKPTGSIGLGNLNENLGSFVRYGGHGLAFRTYSSFGNSGQVYLVTTSLVP